MHVLMLWSRSNCNRPRNWNVEGHVGYLNPGGIICSLHLLFAFLPIKSVGLHKLLILRVWDQSVKAKFLMVHKIDGRLDYVDHEVNKLLLVGSTATQSPLQPHHLAFTSRQQLLEAS